MRAQKYRGTGGPPGHTYDHDGQVRTDERMTRKIVIKIYSHFVFS
jgi:hypothetical protein